MGVAPNHPPWNGIFPYKNHPASLGYPMAVETPNFPWSIVVIPRSQAWRSGAGHAVCSALPWHTPALRFRGAGAGGGKSLHIVICSIYMGVSSNAGTPKSWVSNGFKTQMLDFWRIQGTPLVGNLHIVQDPIHFFSWEMGECSSGPGHSWTILQPARNFAVIAMSCTRWPSWAVSAKRMGSFLMCSIMEADWCKLQRFGGFAVEGTA